jgi:hypothetical protein
MNSTFEIVFLNCKIFSNCINHVLLIFVILKDILIQNMIRNKNVYTNKLACNELTFIILWNYFLYVDY